MEDKMSVSDGNYKLEVFRDEDAENPREWENLGKMVCWHRRYNLGDKHEYEDPQAFRENDNLAQRIREMLIAETKMSDQYLQGDCYAFKIMDGQGDEIDACSGFLGDDLREVLKEMRESCNDEFSGLFDKMEKHSSA
ncbi:MAG: hypothetical protein OSJ74_11235 [Clostridia bacterium]|nr:hypothetical protein [Clostridia bacterium]